MRDHRALDTNRMSGARVGRFLISEVPLYGQVRARYRYGQFLMSEVPLHEVENGKNTLDKNGYFDVAAIAK